VARERPSALSAAIMIDHTLPKYLFIRTCIFGLRAITPFSVFWVSFSIAEPPHTAFRRFLLAWGTIETAFWVLVYIPRKRALQASAQHPPQLPQEERKELFWRCWDKIPHPEYYIRKWFLDARPADVQRENVREFFAWALLNRGTESDDERMKRRQAHPEQFHTEDEELNEYADGIETLLGRKLAPGMGSAKSMRLTIDQVNMAHRPFLWYMVCILLCYAFEILIESDCDACRHHHSHSSTLCRLHALPDPHPHLVGCLPTTPRKSHYTQYFVRSKPELLV
jgi:hypothetical protein